MNGAGLVDHAVLRRLRSEVGGGLPRLLVYFREDGLKSVAALERAARAGNAAAMVIPAHTLKGEALQFGALPLGGLAETIEQAARRCVECHVGAEALVADVLQLRPLFERTMAALGQDSAPAGAAVPGAPAAPPPPASGGRPVFGRRTSGAIAR